MFVVGAVPKNLNLHSKMATCSSLPLGGYTCDFVEDPPEKYECPVCLLVLRDPHLLSCCGVKVCETCVGGVKDIEKPCPLCKQPFVSLLDKELRRAILGLCVHCSLRHRGCQWTGQLLELEKHTSRGDQGDCQYVHVDCRHGCGEAFLRLHLEEHELQHCSKRPVDVKLQRLWVNVEALINNTAKERAAEIQGLCERIEEQEREIAKLKEQLAVDDLKRKHRVVLDRLNKHSLLIMPKLPHGNIPGVSYIASECSVVISGTNQMEVDARKAQFLVTIDKISSLVMVSELSLPFHFPDKDVDTLLQEVNLKHPRCYAMLSNPSYKTKVTLIALSAAEMEEGKKSLDELVKRLPEAQTYKLSRTRTLTIKMGDLSLEEADVIVNAAASDLLHDGGVSAALNHMTNFELQKHSNKYVSQHGEVPTGCVAVTKGGGKLRCKHVVHAVSPSSGLQLSNKQCYELLSEAVRKSLTEAQARKATSIAFPALGTGLFNIPPQIASSALLQSVVDFPYANNKVLTDIRVVIFIDHLFGVFSQYMDTRGLR